jgi:hypothetical protein
LLCFDRKTPYGDGIHQSLFSTGPVPLVQHGLRSYPLAPGWCQRSRSGDVRPRHSGLLPLIGLVARNAQSGKDVEGGSQVEQRRDGVDARRQVTLVVPHGRLCRPGSKPLLPFEKYAQAAERPGQPSSAARALFAGAEHIERVDCLVRRNAGQQGFQSEALDQIVMRVDERLAKNRRAGAAKWHGSIP